MSSLRSSLELLVGLFAAAVGPDAVVLVTDDAEQTPGSPSASDAPVQVRPLSVMRIGRSRRDGPVLDLELRVAVVCSGEYSIDNIESLLRALETTGNYTVGALDPFHGQVSETRLGFVTTVPVSLRLDEPRGPLVREPLVVKTVLVGN